MPLGRKAIKQKYKISGTIQGKNRRESWTGKIKEKKKTGKISKNFIKENWNAKITQNRRPKHRRQSQEM